ncbi:MAG: indole-3-glycerol-phosphate synthase, partial [Promethearchaeota archaeon]
LMISDKIKEIVEKRKESIQIDLDFKNLIEKEIFKDNRKPLSEMIKNNQDISIISEIKPASPTLGEIRKNIDIKTIAKEMEIAGVIGLSILTEPNYFNGSYENLKKAVESTKLPCLMKDFVVDKIQYMIAAHLGATNILIINSICNLEYSYSTALEYNLEPLIEIHDIEELKDIRHLYDIGFNPTLIGVNNRNLKTLEINLNTSKVIIPKLKEEFGDKIQVISESGINTKEDIKSLLQSKANAFLIGSSIMKSRDIREKILSLRGLN